MLLGLEHEKWKYRSIAHAIMCPDAGTHFRLGDYASAIGWFRRGTSERATENFMPKT
jgi:hypothetical protein